MLLGRFLLFFAIGNDLRWTGLSDPFASQGFYRGYCPKWFDLPFARHPVARDTTAADSVEYS